MNSYGVPSETPGEIQTKDTNELGNCYFADGVTPVQRSDEVGNFAYCGDNNEVCSGTYSGAYVSRDYDPRWRGWYIATKALQIPNWSPPYPFFTAGQIGITFSLPIYGLDDLGRHVFEGVLAVDYTFTDISTFLRTNYKDSEIIVAIFEQSDPH